MGRPLNKKFWGTLATSGYQIKLTSAWVPGHGSAVSNCYIVKQVGTGRYLVHNGTVSGVVKLTAGTAAAAGEGYVTVSPYGGGTKYAKTINAHTVKTQDGYVYKWSTAAAAVTGEADLSNG